MLRVAQATTLCELIMAQGISCLYPVLSSSITEQAVCQSKPAALDEELASVPGHLTARAAACCR